MMLLKARDEGKWTEEDAAVVKARVEKEKAAAEERKKKIAEQFQVRGSLAGYGYMNCLDPVPVLESYVYLSRR